MPATCALAGKGLAEAAGVFVGVFNGATWGVAGDASAATLRLTEIFHTPERLGIKVVDDGRMIGFAIGYSETYGAGTEWNARRRGGQECPPSAERQGGAEDCEGS